MAQNDYQIFGDSGVDGVNKLSLANYTADNDRLFGNGYTTKVIRSQLHNKVLQQTSKISAAVAQFLVNNGISALDTDTVSTISTNINNTVINISNAVGFHANSITQIASSAILTAANAGQALYYNSATAGSITLPAAAIGNSATITIYNTAAGALTINRAGADIIDALGFVGVASVILYQGDSVQLATNGVSWIQTSGSRLAIPLGAKSNFSAWQSTAQNIAAATYTVVQFQTKIFDDTGEFNAATGAFTAAASGTYVFSAGVYGSQTTATSRFIAIFVNGSETVRLQEHQNITGRAVVAGGSGPIKLNAGDAVTLCYLSQLADTTVAVQAVTYFKGYRIK
jgi:hypothetical protein